MKKQKHVWIVTDKDGSTGFPFANNLACKVAKELALQNKELVKAAKRLLELVKEFEDALLPNEINELESLEKVLAKEAE